MSVPMIETVFRIVCTSRNGVVYRCGPYEYLDQAERAADRELGIFAATASVQEAVIAWAEVPE